MSKRDTRAKALILALCAMLLFTSCAAGEATLALQRAARSGGRPGYMRFDLTFSAGAADLSAGEQRLTGEIIEDEENLLTLFKVDVMSTGERAQSVEYYLLRGQEYQPTQYRSIDGTWSAQRVSRSYGTRWRDSLSFSLSQDLLKALRNPILIEGSPLVNGVTCQQIEGTLSADRARSWLESSLFPSFFGFPSQANDSTFYDNLTDISAAAYVGQEDGRIYRLTLDLGRALGPLVERMSTTNTTNELWQEMRLRDCVLEIDYMDYDAPQTLVLPEEALGVEPT